MKKTMTSLAVVLLVVGCLLPTHLCQEIQQTVQQNIGKKHYTFKASFDGVYSHMLYLDKDCNKTLTNT